MMPDAIEAIVLEALRTANLARDPSVQLAVARGAAVFGPESPLDSLGLVALLLDIEDALRDRGCPIVLSDERAVSQKRSPFRTVTTLVEYIGSLPQAEQA
jgi:acyl carrier protein